MTYFKTTWAALGAAILVAACGGGGDGNQTPRVAFTSVVSFGDSLSDVGTYRIGPIAAAGGGRFTINPSVVTTPTVWPEFLAAQLGLTSCAARNGYGSVNIPVSGCRNYAQGGARVTDPVGPGHADGALTQPIVIQLANYAADNNADTFTSKQLVTVLAGANDIFGLTAKLAVDAAAVGNTTFAQYLVGQFVAGAPTANQAAALGVIGLAVQTEAANPAATPTSIVTAAATAAGTHAFLNSYTNTAVANATAIGNAAGAAAVAAGNDYAANAGAAAAVTGMATAATELAGYVKTKIVAKGAKYVVVSNLPDVSKTPDSLDQSASAQALILAMTTTFNQYLAAGLANTPEVVLVDAFANIQDQVLNPGRYGVTNVNTRACDMTKVTSSLICNASTLITGDTSHYLFADGVHPTPYVHKLTAQLVLSYLAKAGWL